MVRVVLSLVALALLSGCASMNQKCTYFDDGILESYRVRSTVFGTGETELVTTDCAALAYSTEDTGISDNGKDSILGIAEIVTDSMNPAGSVGGMLDNLLEEDPP
jgi:type IV pilus biogenesis protein CpaD/CtpE